MEEYSIKDRDRTVTFYGDLIGTSTSIGPGKNRWAHMELYAIEGGRYLVHGAGMTVVPGEVDRHWVITCDDARSVESALTRAQNGVSYMPRTNIDLLADAAGVDEGIAEVYGSPAV